MYTDRPLGRAPPRSAYSLLMGYRSIQGQRLHQSPTLINGSMAIAIYAMAIVFLQCLLTLRERSRIILS